MEKELLVLAATAISREKLIEMLEEEILNCKEATLLGKSEQELEEAEGKLGMICHMYTINLMTKGSISSMHVRCILRLITPGDYIKK